MEALQWVFVTTALVLIFIVFAINPIQLATDDAIQNNAQLQARTIASSINLMSTAPDGSTYRIALPSRPCTLVITEHFVSMKITISNSAISEALGTIKTPAAIKGGEFDCKTKGFIQLRKTGNILEII